MRLKFKLNQAEFIIQVVDNNWKPDYICESDMKAIIYLTPSAVINETYKKFFNVKTRFSGPGILGFDNEIITKQLQAEVLVFLLQIIIHSIKFFVATLGSSDQAELDFANIYHQEKHIQTYTEKSPTDV
ncbi:hypothetical protein C1646_767990 [Rhizophagus diaphanus]|nr:hypothetical protein C1646_767990 [Rhizophagus diaphanus] [Rhizophagus sp. MUCL 43196]